MDAMDADMTSSCRDVEEDAGSAPAAGRHDLQSQVPSHGNPWSLLAMAHQLINQGNPSLALQAVVAAMRSQGGEQAVFQTLHRARELYKKKLQANSAANELASLFAECAITEAHPLNSDSPLPLPPPPPLHAAGGPPPVLPDADGASILAMSGRKQIMLDAFSDGSSFVCLQCGGLVSNQRKDEHLAYWCGQV